MNDIATPIKVSPASQVPRTRDEALDLLQHLGWNPGDLSPEETAAIRALYRLNSEVSVADLVKGGER